MHNWNVNLTHTTSTPGQSHSEYGPRSVGCESCLVEQRIPRSTDRPQTQVMAVPGKTPARTDTRQSIQRDRQMRSVWFDVELLAERRLHRKTSRNSSRSSHAGRSHSPTARAPNRTDENGFEEALKIVNSEVKLGRTFPTQRIGRRVFPSTRSGMANPPENETRGVPRHRRLQFISTVATPSSEVLQHHSGRDESRADVTHRGTAAAYMLTTTSRHANTTQSAPPIHRNLLQKSSSSENGSP